MKNLEDLFQHQLKDLYSAETQHLKVIPKLVEAVHDSKLKQLFQDHLKETEDHKKRLEEIAEELGFKPTGEECKAMGGLIKETESFLKEDAEPAVMDAGIIAEAQRIAHYEITGYGTVTRYAKELGHDDIAKKLHEIFKDAENCDKSLNEMAENRLNKKAI
jgi:ferritin-like metal-binding protein YciE